MDEVDKAQEMLDKLNSERHRLMKYKGVWSEVEEVLLVTLTEVLTVVAQGQQNALVDAVAAIIVQRIGEHLGD